MRRRVQQYMPDTVSIISIVTSYSSETGQTTTPSVVSTVKGKLYDVSGSERNLLTPLVNDGTENLETAKIDLPYDTEIDSTNQVLTSDGKYWNVHSTNSSQSFVAMKQALLYRKIVNSVVT